MITFLMFVLKVETSFVVLSESYLKSVDKRIKVVSVSMISALLSPQKIVLDFEQYYFLLPLLN